MTLGVSLLEHLLDYMAACNQRQTIVVRYQEYKTNSDIATRVVGSKSGVHNLLLNLNYNKRWRQRFRKTTHRHDCKKSAKTESS